MRKATWIIAIALIAIIMFSGCIGPSKDKKVTGRGPGIEITNFMADFDSMDAGETMSLVVDFENRGDVVAEDVLGTLIRKGVFIIYLQGKRLLLL